MLAEWRHGTPSRFRRIIILCLVRSTNLLHDFRMPASEIRSTDRIWRVFYTRSRAEKKVEDDLVRKELEVFLPKRVVTRQWSDRKKRVVQALFPGYIFARVDERERLSVLESEHVVRCIAMDGRVVRVSDYEIELLKSLQRDPERLEAVRLPLPERGVMVEIRRGQLMGLRGEVIEHRRGTAVLIRIPSIRQAVKVEVPADWVEKVG